jgi:prepilin-type N-terminal cleavage/methylation domain-containing protein/prepilin-type processing-associated H-X9-DG protein
VEKKSVGRGAPSGNKSARAFTLIELLVCIVIVGLLLALLLPGVQMIRETSRKVHCRSNLKQIGIAIASYESAHQMFPPGASYGASMHVILLPYLDLTALYEAYDFIKRDDGALRTVEIPLYRCPSDPAPPALPQGVTADVATNYAGNSGTGVLKYGYNGMFRHISPESPPRRDGPIRPADVRDGMSNTAAVCEILHADGSSARLRVNWNTPVTFPEPDLLDDFAEYCAGIPPIPSDYGWQGATRSRGVPWTFGDVTYTMYNHVLGPNQPSCYNGTDVQTAIASAGSAHNGGVNVLYADGHLEFVSSSTDLRLWRDIGSRVESDLILSP